MAFNLPQVKFLLLRSGVLDPRHSNSWLQEPVVLSGNSGSKCSYQLGQNISRPLVLSGQACGW